MIKKQTSKKPGKGTPNKQIKDKVKPEEEEVEKKQESSDSSVDFDADDPNQKFFNIKDIKPLDLKAQWLGNTAEVLNKFNSKMEELKKEKIIIKASFEAFAQNENKFKISSLRKINFQFDKKALYQKFMKESRRTIEKLHPSLIINICSYISANVFLSLSKIRRVSQIFNYIYNNEQVVSVFSSKNFGTIDVSLKDQVRWCKLYVNFVETFLYYKQIKYTHLIPQNSIKEDLQKAVEFINEVYKQMYQGKLSQTGYFNLINSFMKTHRVPIALESLSFTDMAVTKKGAIVAFSNYLAFNPASRLKEEITKTKYKKMIEMVQDEECHDALVVNSRISSFLMEEYNYEIAAFVDTLKKYPYHLKLETYPAYDLVIFNYHNHLKSFLARGVTFQNGTLQINKVLLEFSEDFKGCRLNFVEGQGLESQYILHRYLPTVGPNRTFGHSYLFRGQLYYILLIPLNPEQVL